MKISTNRALLNLLQWAISELSFLEELKLTGGEYDTYEKDLWIDISCLIGDCSRLLNDNGKADEFQIVDAARNIRERMKGVRGCDEWTLSINQMRGLDADWDDDWNGDEESSP